MAVGCCGGRDLDGGPRESGQKVHRHGQRAVGQRRRQHLAGLVGTGDQGVGGFGGPRRGLVEPRGGARPLYGCAWCGEVECGAITVGVDPFAPSSGVQVVRWEDVRLEDTFTPAEEMVDLSAIGPFTFDRARYDRVLAETVVTLEELAREDDAAAQQRRAQRSLAGRVRRLLGR